MAELLPSLEAQCILFIHPAIGGHVASFLPVGSCEYSAGEHPCSGFVRTCFPGSICVFRFCADMFSGLLDAYRGAESLGHLVTL